MKKKSLTKYIILLSAAFILLIAVPFWINSWVKFHQLTLNEKPTFDIMPFVNLSHENISEETEVFNKDKFIEYNCIYKDSCLILIDIGAVKNIYADVTDIIQIEHNPIKTPNKIFNGTIFSPTKIRESTLFAYYNVDLIPSDSINNINLYVDGNINEINKESVDRVKFGLSSKLITISLNNNREVDISFPLLVAKEKLLDVDLTFQVEKGRLYAVLQAKKWDAEGFVN